ncbi:phage holin family protein [Demequina oxidasica]|uniref:phage holin family protein n=1 Tax=Demequina oxidasica TaxID=676199 RepID=UPI0007853C81|nr:phage holin family protein [Demequina oxidasica]
MSKNAGGSAAPTSTARTAQSVADAMVASGVGHERYSRGRGAADVLIRAVAMGLTVWISPGITQTSWWSLPLAVAAIVAASWALRPLLVRIAGLFGWIGALALALFANAVFVGAGLWLTPGIETSSVTAAVVASWVYALLLTVIAWCFSVSTQVYLMVHALRMSSKRQGSARGKDDAAQSGRSRIEDPDVTGVLFVQLDGVPAPVLRGEIRAGNLPTLSRWIRSGSHKLVEWRAEVPSTTPVSQAGILHGNNDNIPAFRWWDRSLGRLVVANVPADAALIEERVSNGRGLLADDGVSISNLFSGDAAVAQVTVSGLRNKTEGLGPSESYASFFTHPAGFLRAVILSIGEAFKELFQARRQERRDVRPRIKRAGNYVALRAITNVFLRDLNVALIVEAMMAGRKSIYVDFVDYDEVAHHAGVTRPESLASLYGLDDVMRGLEALADSGATPRPYKIVAVSDHGQSQGSTFLQRYGMSLEEFVTAHIDNPDAPKQAPVSGHHVEASTARHESEQWGLANELATELGGQSSVTGRLTHRALAKDAAAPAAPTEGLDRPRIAVVGSGNLGGIWFAQHTKRLTLSAIERGYPGLVEALATHPGIGFLVVATPHGPVAIGAAGVVNLTTGVVTGTDPLAAFGDDARADFARVAEFTDAPDIYVNSLYDADLDEVAAFEELVGSHGGVGGWQTRPLLVYPSEWKIYGALLDDRGRLSGAETVHRQLVEWLEQLGHRQTLSQAAEERDAP